MLYELSQNSKHYRVLYLKYQLLEIKLYLKSQLLEIKVMNAWSWAVIIDRKTLFAQTVTEYWKVFITRKVIFY